MGFLERPQEPWMQSTAVIFGGKSAESNQPNTKKGKGRKAPTSRICPHDKTPTGSKDQHQEIRGALTLHSTGGTVKYQFCTTASSNKILEAKWEVPEERLVLVQAGKWTKAFIEPGKGVYTYAESIKRRRHSFLILVRPN